MQKARKMVRCGSGYISSQMKFGPLTERSFTIENTVEREIVMR